MLLAVRCEKPPHFSASGVSQVTKVRLTVHNASASGSVTADTTPCCCACGQPFAVEWNPAETEVVYAVPVEDTK